MSKTSINRGNFYFEARSDDSDDEEFNTESVEITPVDSGYVLSESAASIIVALSVQSREAFDDSLRMIAQLEAHAQMQEAIKASSDRKYAKNLYDRASKLRDRYSTEQLKRMLSDVVLGEKEDRMDYFRAVLFEAGATSCYISDDGHTSVRLSHTVENAIKGILENPSQIKFSLDAKNSERDLVMAKRLFPAFESYYKPDEKTDLYYLEHMTKLHAWFFAGSSPVDISIAKPERYQPLKQVGFGEVSGGETDIAVERVATLFASEEVDAAAVFLGESDPNTAVSIPGPGLASFSLSDDENHPFYYEWSPSIFCHQYDDSGRWLWREEEAKISLDATTEMKKQSITSNKEQVQIRQEMIDHNRLYRARELAEEAGYSKELYIPVASGGGALPAYWKEKLGLTNFILFHKRGWSKLQEVSEHPSRVHFIPHTLVDDCVTKGFHPYLVSPASLTVMIVPGPLLRMCASVRRDSSKKGRKKKKVIQNHIMVPYPVGLDMRGFGALSCLVVGFLRTADKKYHDRDYMMSVLEGLFSRSHSAYNTVKPLVPDGVDLQMFLRYMGNILDLIYRDLGLTFISAGTSRTGRTKMTRARVGGLSLSFVEDDDDYDEEADLEYYSRFDFSSRDSPPTDASPSAPEVPPPDRKEKVVNPLGSSL